MAYRIILVKSDSRCGPVWTADRAMQEGEQNQDVMLKTILGILFCMILTDARQNLEDLRILESNLLGFEVGMVCMSYPVRPV